MSRSKQARAREFSPAARKEIIRRDYRECIFCKLQYEMEGADWLAVEVKSIMHYIPRSQGGLGIPENGVVGCQWHHDMMDNGNRGKREEMLNIFREYLKKHYPGWDKKKLVYDKWEFLKGEVS